MAVDDLKQQIVDARFYKLQSLRWAQVGRGKHCSQAALLHSAHYSAVSLQLSVACQLLTSFSGRVVLAHVEVPTLSSFPFPWNATAGLKT